MEIITLKVGEMGANCYLAYDKETNETLVIDPGDEGDFITTTILENKLIPKGIILTHGHYDHCLAALEVKLNFNIPIYLHKKDLFLYEKAHLSAKHFSGITIPQLPRIDHFLINGQIISFGGSILITLHTPGHTPGSCCFSGVTPSILFTGDTLFSSGSGKADHKYSSLSQLRKSVSLIKKNYADSLIYPGHEEYGVYSRR